MEQKKGKDKNEHRKSKSLRVSRKFFLHRLNLVLMYVSGKVTGEAILRYSKLGEFFSSSLDYPFNYSRKEDKAMHIPPCSALCPAVC
jgi:hypothetical protein